MRVLWKALVAAALVVLLAPSPAHAHPMDFSKVRLVVEEDAVRGSVEIAVPALQQVLGADFSAADEAELTTYLRGHIAAGTDGTHWPLSFGTTGTRQHEGMAWVTTSFSFASGPAAGDAFLFEYDAVTAEVARHEADVVVTDAGGRTVVSGVLTQMIPAVTIEREVSTSVSAMAGQGFRHVLEGADHLLFLMTLLLPAPLLALGRRWVRRRSVAGSIWAVVRVATAFTVGHSLTLVAAAQQWVEVPSGPVEVVIAISVGVAAVHALRPLVRGGEDLIAVGFGLVHGLAFAGILADLGLGGSASWPALLGFNLGIELAQLVVVGLVFPSLYALSTTRWYPGVRIVGASAVLAASAGWALERLGVLDNPLAPIEDAAVGHPWVVVAALATLALVAVGRERLAAEPLPA